MGFSNLVVIVLLEKNMWEMFVGEVWGKFYIIFKERKYHKTGKLQTKCFLVISFIVYKYMLWLGVSGVR